MAGYRLRVRCGPPVVSGDDHGLSGAPVATIQHPRALDLSGETNEFGVTLALRTPWSVPGVDYAVGVPTGLTLLDAASASLPAGCTRNAGLKTIYVDGSSDVTFNGYDFSPSNFVVYVRKTFSAKLKIENCKFVVGPNGSSPVYFENQQSSTPVIGPQCGLFTLRYTYMSGAAIDIVGFLFNVPKGGVLAEYNHFSRAVADVCDAGVEELAQFVFRYNVFEDAGYGTYAHTDFLQIWNGKAALGDFTADFDLTGDYRVHDNLFIQPAADPVTKFPGSLSSCLRVGDLGGKTCYNPKFYNNTVIGIGNSGHNQNGVSTSPAMGTMTQFVTSNEVYGVIDSPVSRDNYFYTSPGGAFNGAGKNGFGNFANYPISGVNQNITGAVDYSNNINMRDGSSAPVYP